MTDPNDLDGLDRDNLDPAQTTAAALGLPIPPAEPDDLDARQFVNKAFGQPVGPSWADQLDTPEGMVAAALGRPHPAPSKPTRTAAQTTVADALGLD